MPDHTQCMELLLVEERSIVSRDISLSWWKKKLMLGQNLPQCVQMMLINSLVWDVRVTGYGSRKLEIGVPPFLSNITPVSLRLREEEEEEEWSPSQPKTLLREQQTHQAFRPGSDLGSNRRRCSGQSLITRTFESIGYSSTPVDTCPKDIEEESLWLRIWKRHGC